MTHACNLFYYVQKASTLKHLVYQHLDKYGIFIPTSKKYMIGQKLTLYLMLSNNKLYQQSGSVVFIQPKNALNSKPQGVGMSITKGTTLFEELKLLTFQPVSQSQSYWL